MRDPSKPGYWNAPPPHELSVPCEWTGRFHLPVGIEPAVIAFLLVGCLLGCYRKNMETMSANRKLRFTDLNGDSGQAHHRRGGRQSAGRHVLLTQVEIDSDGHSGGSVGVGQRQAPQLLKA